MGCGSGKQLQNKKELKQILVLNDQGTPNFNDKYLVNSLYTSESQTGNSNNLFKNPDNTQSERNNDKINIISDRQMIPYIKCQNHKERQIELIDISQQNQQKIYCYQCTFLLKNQQSNQFLLLKDIFSDSNYQFTKKFIKFKDPVNNYLFQSFTNYCSEDRIFIYLEKSLTQLKEVINLFIENIIQQLKENKCKYEILKKQRQQLSVNCEAKLMLKKCILKYSHFPNQLEQELKNIDTQIQEKKKTMEKELLDIIQNQKNLLQDCMNIIYNFHNKLSYELKTQSEFTNKLPYMFQYNLEDLKQIFDSQLDLSKMNTVQMTGNLKVSLNSNQIEFLNTVDESQSIMLSYNFNQYSFYKYEILIEIQQQKAEDPLQIQLNNSDGRQVQFTNINIPCFKSSDLDKFNNIYVDKGKLIHQDEVSFKELKIQICIKEKVFRWIIGDNINSIMDWKDFDSNQMAVLFFECNVQNQKLTIKHIKKVLEFERW